MAGLSKARYVSAQQWRSVVGFGRVQQGQGAALSIEATAKRIDAAWCMYRIAMARSRGAQYGIAKARYGNTEPSQGEVGHSKVAFSKAMAERGTARRGVAEARHSTELLCNGKAQLCISA